MMVQLGKRLFSRKNQRHAMLMVGVGLIALCLPLFITDEFFLDVIILSFFYAYMALSWNLLGGKTGMFSLGHAGFFGIGAYTSTLLYLKFGISPWVGISIGASLSGLVGMVFFYPCFRLHGLFFALATLAFAEVLLILFLHFDSITGGGVGLSIPYKPGLKNLIFDGKTGYYYVFLFALVILIGISDLIGRSKFGWRLEAIREDERTAQTLGISVVQNKLCVVGISSFFAGAGGALYAQYLLFISPDFIFSWVFSVQFLLVCIVGGLQTVMGPVLGSFLLTPLEVSARFMFNEWSGLSYAVYGLVLIVMSVALPEGLLPLLSRIVSMTIQKRDEETPRIIKISKPIQRGILDESSWENRMISTNDIILRLERVSKDFSGLRALNDVSFSVHRGEVLGLIGPNGAGKTTLLNIICGFLRPSEGTALFDGQRISRLSPTCISRVGVGRTFQIVRPFSKLSVMENIMVACLYKAPSFGMAQKRAMEILNRMDLSESQHKKPDNLPLVVRKRLEIARALGIQPKLLLLDEVMSGLRPTEQDDLIKSIRQVALQGITIVIIEHVMRVISSICDRIVVLNFGHKIAVGGTQEVLNSPTVIEAYLGRRSKIADGGGS